MKKIVIEPTDGLIDKIHICRTIKRFKQKPAKGHTCQVQNEIVTLIDFKSLIEKGHSFKFWYDIDKIRRDIYKIIPLDDPNQFAVLYRKNILNHNKMTANILQRKSAIDHCSFQYVFFDIDYCTSDYKNIVKNMVQKPNIVYETFSYTPQKPRYRFVYILDRVIPCEFYPNVYETIAKKIRKVVKLDNCGKSPTQTFYGTNHFAYVINDKFYTLNLPQDISMAVPESKPLFEESDLESNEVAQPELIAYPLEFDFYNTCCSISLNGVLERYKDQCTVIEYETLQSIFEKFIYKEEGLLTLPTYKVVNGVRTKIIMNNQRKMYIREVIANLLLLMNKNITTEDLVYNVFRWCKEHISFNKTINNHILSNKKIIELCMETYNRFHSPHSPEYDNYLDSLKKKYRSAKKNYINPYYFGLHFDDDTYCCNRYEIWQRHPVPQVAKYKFSYHPITLDLLKKQQIRGRKQRSDKQVPHSKTTKLIVEYLRNGIKNKRIVEKLKNEHGITTNSQNVSKIKKRFHI